MRASFQCTQTELNALARHLWIVVFEKLAHDLGRAGSAGHGINDFVQQRVLRTGEKSWTILAGENAANQLRKLAALRRALRMALQRLRHVADFRPGTERTVTDFLNVQRERRVRYDIEQISP